MMASVSGASARSLPPGCGRPVFDGLTATLVDLAGEHFVDHVRRFFAGGMSSIPAASIVKLFFGFGWIIADRVDAVQWSFQSFANVRRVPDIVSSLGSDKIDFVTCSFSRSSWSVQLCQWRWSAFARASRYWANESRSLVDKTRLAAFLDPLQSSR